MTKVIVNSGICGFKVAISAEKDNDRKVHISLDTECDMVKKMQEDISVLAMNSVFTGHLSNPVYRSAGKHLKHPACPVPAGILKALEAELGLSIPRDASIIFVKE